MMIGSLDDSNLKRVVEHSTNSPTRERAIYLVIVNYYACELIAGLLDSIPLAARGRVEAIAINNSPEDGDIPHLTEKFPNLTLLKPETNLGFGSGCNLGLEYVYQINPQALVWLINPDTTIEPTAIDYILECFAQNPDLAILGTRIRDTQGNIWFSEGRFNRWIGSLKHQSGKERGREKEFFDNYECPEIIPSRWVSGCSMLLNLEKFARCPNFDPHYFLYYEDNDLCERYYQLGYQIAVTQAVLVTHLVSATTHKDKSAKFRHATYSKLYFLQQHGTILALGLNLIYMLVKIVRILGQDTSIAIGRWQGLQKFIAQTMNLSEFSNKQKNH